MATAAKSEIVLEIKNLCTYFYTQEGELKAVDGLSYNVNKGESVGLVGESACGKSVSALSIMRLIPYPPGIIVGGSGQKRVVVRARHHRRRRNFIPG